MFTYVFSAWFRGPCTCSTVPCPSSVGDGEIPQDRGWVLMRSYPEPVLFQNTLLKFLFYSLKHSFVTLPFRRKLSIIFEGYKVN